MLKVGVGVHPLMMTRVLKHSLIVPSHLSLAENTGNKDDINCVYKTFYIIWIWSSTILLSIHSSIKSRTITQKYCNKNLFLLPFLQFNTFPIYCQLYAMSSVLQNVGTSDIFHEVHPESSKTGFSIKSQPPLHICRHHFFL